MTVFLRVLELPSTTKPRAALRVPSQAGMERRSASTRVRA